MEFFARLKDYCDILGPSGMEDLVRERIIADIKDSGAEYEVDALGNLIVSHSEVLGNRSSHQCRINHMIAQSGNIGAKLTDRRADHTLQMIFLILQLIKRG